VLTSQPLPALTSQLAKPASHAATAQAPAAQAAAPAQSAVYAPA